MKTKAILIVAIILLLFLSGCKSEEDKMNEIKDLYVNEDYSNLIIKATNYMNESSEASAEVKTYLLSEMSRDTISLINSYDYEVCLKFNKLEKDLFKTDNIEQLILNNLYLDVEEKLDNRDYEKAFVMVEYEEKNFNKSVLRTMITDVIIINANEFLKIDNYDKCYELKLFEKNNLGSNEIEILLRNQLNQKLTGLITSMDLNGISAILENVSTYLTQYIEDFEGFLIVDVNNILNEQFNNNEYTSVRETYEEYVSVFGEVFDKELYSLLTKKPLKPEFETISDYYIDDGPKLIIMNDEYTYYYSINSNIVTLDSNIYKGSFEVAEADVEISVVAINKYGTISDVTKVQVSIQQGNYYWLTESKDDERYTSKYVTYIGSFMYDMLHLQPLTFTNLFVDYVTDVNFLDLQGNSKTYKDYEIIDKMTEALGLKAKLIDKFNEISGDVYYKNNGVSYDFLPYTNLTPDNVEKGFAASNAAYSAKYDIGFTAYVVHSGAAGYILEYYPDSDLNKKIDAYIDAINELEPNMTHKYFKLILPEYLEENYYDIYMSVLVSLWP